MESIVLFGSGSLSKLPFDKPYSSSANLMVPSTSRLCLNFSKPLFTKLISTDHGFTWNPDARDKFLARCSGNEHNGKKTHSNEKRDALKSLFSLTQPDQKNSIIRATKNEALKMALEEKYDEASCHMLQLFNGDPDEAYEARLAHLQILIHIDKYIEALEFLEKKGNFPQSKAFDSRLSLYKAVVYTMLGNNYDAKKWWKSYLDFDIEIGNSNRFLLSAKRLLKPLLSLKPDRSDINSTKNKALKEVLNGKHDAAKRHMEDFLESEDVRKSKEMECLNAQLPYIQILIYLDKYEEAHKRINEISSQFPETNPTPVLYKAIGLTGSGKHEDAEDLWKAFMETIDAFDPTNL